MASPENTGTSLGGSSSLAVVTSGYDFNPGDPMFHGTAILIPRVYLLLGYLPVETIRNLAYGRNFAINRRLNQTLSHFAQLEGVSMAFLDGEHKHIAERFFLPPAGRVAGLSRLKFHFLLADGKALKWRDFISGDAVGSSASVNTTLT